MLAAFVGCALETKIPFRQPFQCLLSRTAGNGISTPGSLFRVKSLFYRPEHQFNLPDIANGRDKLAIKGTVAYL
jgi:hypothetical protein